MKLGVGAELLWQLIRNRRRARWPQQRVQAYQARELARLRTQAYKRSPFYRRFHAGLTDRPLSELPVLTKALMMDHFDEVVTDPTIRLAEVSAQLKSGRGGEPYLGTYWLSGTSGSSGVHGLFVQTDAELAAYLATSFQGIELTAAQEGRGRQRRLGLVVAGLPTGDLAQLSGQDRRSALVPTRVFDRHAPIDTLVAELNAWRPDILYMLTSCMAELAEEQLAGRLRIAPGRMVPSGEVLTDQIRARAEAAWGKVVYDTYGANECGLLGIECRQHAGLHLVNDRVLLEVVDTNNRPVQAGQYGEKVLITVLYRRTQPLIRYELADLVRLEAGPCACGHPTPRIGDVQGRVWEVLHLPAPDGSRIAVSLLTIYDVMEHFDANFQVRQEVDGLRVLLSHARGEIRDDEVASALRQAMKAVGALPPRVVVERVETIAPDPSGKAPLIKSTVPREAVAG